MELKNLLIKQAIYIPILYFGTVIIASLFALDYSHIGQHATLAQKVCASGEGDQRSGVRAAIRAFAQPLAMIVAQPASCSPEIGRAHV